MNIQIRHIRAFIAVADERSFARAAERLNVSQPALSQTIIQFEGTLGFPVFERTTRSVTLTQSGERLLARARTLNQDIDAFQGEARALQLALKNRLRVGYMIGTAVQFIPAIIREFERIRPGASLDLQEFDFSDPTAGLRDGKVDCGIIRPPVDLDDIEIVAIAREKCVVCLPTGHRLALQETVELDDILDEPIVAAPVPGVWRDYWLANDYRVNRPAKVVFEAATVESELQAVASGRGISITADSTAQYYARPGVVFRQIVDMRECVIAIGYRGQPNRLVADFISVVNRVSQGSHIQVGA
ncbi:LysR family transcriptional regulator [Mesorhizobium tamadayense]|uniref:LysR family transcriptional regulator n=1 Tax=Mesorhizobium tamadayense TaxID=425306 RepID=A0A3P3ESM1_9HYPH|nr:LysR family transcriptional regulator [Mesorhizobium tamadayense]RRH88368.1 LysR family transcriptional regulator [Mesorhizobium tamadayense]